MDGFHYQESPASLAACGSVGKPMCQDESAGSTLRNIGKGYCNGRFDSM
jgi:hypothetical protein